MEELKNIFKITAMLVAILLFSYFYFFKLAPNKEEVKKEVLEFCLPLQYDFKIISYYEDRYYNFSGRTKEGKIVKFKLPHQWELAGNCSIGDSIHKLAGEKELYLIKSDTILKLPLKVHGEDVEF